jgi:hypothetical protein
MAYGVLYFAMLRSVISNLHACVLDGVCGIDLSTEIQEGVKITLDCAQASFIASDKLVISLRGGEL